MQHLRCNAHVGWGSHPDISPPFAEETNPRLDVDHCLRRFRTLKGPSHFSLLAQRKVTQRNGLKGSWHGKDKSPNAYVQTESWSPKVLRSGYSARRRSAAGLKRVCQPSRLALSPQRFGASRYRGTVEASEPTIIARALNFQACNPLRAMSSSGHFFGLLFFGPAKKSDSVAYGDRKRRRQCHTSRNAATWPCWGSALPRPNLREHLEGFVGWGANPNMARSTNMAMLGFAPQPTE